MELKKLFFITVMLIVMFSKPVFGDELVQSMLDNSKNIVYAGHVNEFSGKLYIGSQKGNWENTRDFILPINSEIAVSPNNRYVVIGALTPKREIPTLYCWDLLKQTTKPLVVTDAHDIVFSPDSQKVLYYKISDVIGSQGYHNLELCYADVNNGVSTLVLKPSRNQVVYDAQWSADGKKIFYIDGYYLSYGTGMFKILCYDLSTQKTSMIAETNAIVVFAISPSMDNIAYFEEAGNSKFNLILHNLSNGKKEILISSTRRGLDIKFSPSGKKILCEMDKGTNVCESENFVYDLTNKTNTYIGPGTKGIWSSDENSILCKSNDTSDKWPKLMILNATSLKPQILDVPQTDLFYYNWIHPNQTFLKERGPLNISPEVTGYNLWTEEVKPLIPVKSFTVKDSNSGLEFEVKILPNSKESDNQSLDITIRKDGRILGEQDIITGCFSLTGNSDGDYYGGHNMYNMWRGHSRGGSVNYKGSGIITFSFEGTYNEQSIKFSKVIH